MHRQQSQNWGLRGNKSRCQQQPVVTYCHLQPPLTSEIPFNIFDLTRSSQEADSLSSNTHLRLVLVAIPTFNCLPQGNQTILPLNSFKKVVKKTGGGGGETRHVLNKVSVPNWPQQCVVSSAQRKSVYRKAKSWPEWLINGRGFYS